MALFGKKTKTADASSEKEVKKVEAKNTTTKKAPAKKAEKVEKAVVPVKEKSKTEKRAEAAAGVSFPKGSAVISPRVTDKSGLLSQKGIYTFNVRAGVNVYQIAQAIETAYKVTPVKVAVVPVKGKAVFARGKAGMTAGGRKAYVYLKKGDVIEFI